MAHRREQRLRQWAVIGGSAAGVVLFVAVLVLVGGGDDSSPRAASPTTVTTRVHRSTTTTTTSDLSSTTSSSAPGAEVGPGPGSTTDDATAIPPATDPSDPATDPTANVSVTEDAGACAWNVETEELTDSGTLVNSGTEEATVEVEVIWSDASGELDSWSTIETVPAGGNTTWSVSSAWVDAPQGLTCQTALI